MAAAPGNVQGNRWASFPCLPDDEASCGRLPLGHRSRQVADAAAGGLGRCLALDVRHGQRWLTGEQADSACCQRPRRVGDDDRALRAQHFGRQWFWLAGQRMIRGDRENELETAQRRYGETAARRHVAGGSDGKIGAPIEQRIPAAGKYLTGDANLCAMSCGMELRNQRQQARYRDDPVYGDRQIVFPAARDLSGATLGLPGGIKQRAAVVEQAAPGAGQNRSPALAFKQCEAQLRFCLANRVRRRRGNPVQVLGRGGEGAQSFDRVEQLKQFERNVQNNRI